MLMVNKQQADPGLGIALVTGPLGCFVVWRRLSYFGDTLLTRLGVTMAYT